MQGFAQAVLEDYGEKLDPGGREYLQRISNSALRLDRLIQEVLTFSRIGRGELTVGPVDLNKLLDEVMHMYPVIRASAAEIRFEGPLQSVLGSHSSLVQGISNLLTNAVKFVAPGAKANIRIWTEKHGSKVQLFVEDNGIGIPGNLLS